MVHRTRICNGKFDPLSCMVFINVLMFWNLWKISILRIIGVAGILRGGGDKLPSPIE